MHASPAMAAAATSEAVNAPPPVAVVRRSTVTAVHAVKAESSLPALRRTWTLARMLCGRPFDRALWRVHRRLRKTLAVVRVVAAASAIVCLFVPPPWSAIFAALSALAIPVSVFLGLGLSNVDLLRQLFLLSFEPYYLTVQATLTLVFASTMLRWDVRCLGVLSVWFQYIALLFRDARLTDTRQAVLAVEIGLQVVLLAVAVAAVLSDAIPGLVNPRFSVGRITFNSGKVVASALATMALFLAKNVVLMVRFPTSMLLISARVRSNFRAGGGGDGGGGDASSLDKEVVHAHRTGPPVGGGVSGQPAGGAPPTSEPPPRSSAAAGRLAPAVDRAHAAGDAARGRAFVACADAAALLEVARSPSLHGPAVGSGSDTGDDTDTATSPGPVAADEAEPEGDVPAGLQRPVDDAAEEEEEEEDAEEDGEEEPRARRVGSGAEASLSASTIDPRLVAVAPSLASEATSPAEGAGATKDGRQAKGPDALDPSDRRADADVALTLTLHERDTLVRSLCGARAALWLRQLNDRHSTVMLAVIGACTVWALVDLVAVPADMPLQLLALLTLPGVVVLVLWTLMLHRKLLATLALFFEFWYLMLQSVVLYGALAALLSDVRVVCCVVGFCNMSGTITQDAWPPGRRGALVTSALACLLLLILAAVLLADAIPGTRDRAIVFGRSGDGAGVGGVEWRVSEVALGAAGTLAFFFAKNCVLLVLRPDAFVIIRARVRRPPPLRWQRVPAPGSRSGSATVRRRVLQTAADAESRDVALPSASRGSTGRPKAEVDQAPVTARPYAARRRSSVESKIRRGALAVSEAPAVTTTAGGPDEGLDGADRAVPAR